MALIVDWLKGLLPHVEKKTVLEDLRITETELQTIVLPAYSQAAEFFAIGKFASKDNNKIDERVQQAVRGMKGPKGGNFIDLFNNRLVKVQHNIGLVMKAIDGEIGRDLVTEGVSSKKIVLLRISENLAYISRYSLDLLNLVYLNEAIALGSDKHHIDMSPAEIAKALNSVEALARLITSYGIDSSVFQELIDKTPELILTRSGNDDIEATYGDAELDPVTNPLARGFSPGTLVLRVRMSVAEWQVKRYKANQEKKKLLELRLLHLNSLKNQGGTNPKLEQEISYTQSRVGKLDRAILEAEQDVGLAA